MRQYTHIYPSTKKNYFQSVTQIHKMIYAQKYLGIKSFIEILFIIANVYQQRLFEQTMIHSHEEILTAIKKKMVKISI